MTVQTQLDPLSRSLLATIGRAILMIATGEITVPEGYTVFDPSLAAARGQLRGSDGVQLRKRRNFVPRICYSVKPNIPAKKLEGMTPAEKRVVKLLTTKPMQTVPDLVTSSQLAPKTVANILSTLSVAKVLIRENVLSGGEDE